jgi:hypothetical protein
VTLMIKKKSSSSYRTALIVGFLLTTIFVQAVSSMRQESPLGDELVHISAGYSYLVTRDFRLDPNHPPLIRELAAIPLLFMGLTLPTDHPFWNNTRTGSIQR